MKPLLSTLIPADGRKDSIQRPTNSLINPVAGREKLGLTLEENMIVAEPVLQSAVDEREMRERLKDKYVECLGKAAVEITSLRQTIHALIEWGVSRRELMKWALEAGYSTGYVRSLVS